MPGFPLAAVSSDVGELATTGQARSAVLGLVCPGGAKALLWALHLLYGAAVQGFCSGPFPSTPPRPQLAMFSVSRAGKTACLLATLKTPKPCS